MVPWARLSWPFDQLFNICKCINITPSGIVSCFDHLMLGLHAASDEIMGLKNVAEFLRFRIPGLQNSLWSWNSWSWCQSGYCTLQCWSCPQKWERLWRLSSCTMAFLLCVVSTDCKKCPEFRAEQPDAERYLLLLWKVVWGNYSAIASSSVVFAEHFSISLMIRRLLNILGMLGSPLRLTSFFLVVDIMFHCRDMFVKVQSRSQSFFAPQPAGVNARGSSDQIFKNSSHKWICSQVWLRSVQWPQRLGVDKRTKKKPQR